MHGDTGDRFLPGRCASFGRTVIEHESEVEAQHLHALLSGLPVMLIVVEVILENFPSGAARVQHAWPNHAVWIVHAHVYCTPIGQSRCGDDGTEIDTHWRITAIAESKPNSRPLRCGVWLRVHRDVETADAANFGAVVRDTG